jgi:hypothetical protein
MGVPKQYLGIEIEQTKEGIRLHQTRYAEEILKRFGMENAHGVDTPMAPHSKLSKCEDESKLLNKEDKATYQSIVGALMYLMVCTRPDLAFTLSRLSKFCDSPSTVHMKAARYALRYLRQTTNHGIFYRRQASRMHLQGFSDSDFAADTDNRRSTSGYVFTINGSAISWRSKQQGLVTISTMEAEYVGMTEACKELLWLQRLLEDIQPNRDQNNQDVYITDKPADDGSHMLHADNQGAIALAENPKHHNRSKHIDVKYHFIRELVNSIDNRDEKSRISLQYCQTSKNTADVLTKPLSKLKHQEHVLAMGITTGLSQ